jgi:hypothetical protein
LPSSLRRVRTIVERGSRGRAYMRQQICHQDFRKGFLPSQGPRASVPRHPHQQDVVLRWCRSVCLPFTYSDKPEFFLLDFKPACVAHGASLTERSLVSTLAK